MTNHEIYVLRHGETEWNKAGRMQGALDSPLTEKGRRQAADQGKILDRCNLTGFTWFSSPQGRSIATAALAVPNVTPELDSRLAEISVGDWDGADRAEMQKAAPHVFELDAELEWYDHAPGGEGFDALETRCRSFLNDLSGPAVIFTHGITSRFLRCLAQGLPIEAFSDVDGGQGIIYRILDGKQTKLTLQAGSDFGN
ncbi:MAG: histidine phosphatase family protein [Paracoccaceae bacterium]